MTYFFFYGIFKGRPDFGFLTGCKYIGEATAPGFVLLEHTGPAAMVPGRKAWSVRDRDGDESVAKGTVIGVPDELLPEVMHRLDRTESNGRTYIRAMIEAKLETGAGWIGITPKRSFPMAIGKVTGDAKSNGSDMPLWGHGRV